MNDMLAMFPRDKHLLYLAGNWLMLDNGDGAAQQKDVRKALALDKKYPAGPERSGLCVRAESGVFEGVRDHGSLTVAVLPKGTEPT